MRGAEHLIAMRRQGLRPVLVFVETGPDGRIDEQLNRDDQASAHLWVEPHESIGRLDLRCLVGLGVSVSGPDEKRVVGVVNAALAAGAKRVVGAVLMPVGQGEFRRFPVTRYLDTLASPDWIDTSEESAHG